MKEFYGWDYNAASQCEYVAPADFAAFLFNSGFANVHTNMYTHLSWLWPIPCKIKI